MTPKPANKQSIAIDIDDVLSAHVDSFIKFSNNNYGTSLTREGYSDHWSDLWKVEREEIERRAKEFHIPKIAAEYGLIEESDRAIETLSKKYDLFIVTARGRNLIKTTEGWLDRYFPGAFKDIHFVPIWEPNNEITKADICKEIGADYLIDDIPRHCNIAAQAGIQALLFGDYSWNRYEKLEKGVMRVRDWQEVLEYFYGR